MNTEEFSDKFDSLVNSYSGTEVFGDTRRVQSIEFDEYEKSIFLSNAQLEIVKGLYNDFEKKESSRQYLRNLIKGYSSIDKIISELNIDTDSTFFEIPLEVMYILNESIQVPEDIVDEVIVTEKTIPVLPITHDEYYLQKRNPFRKPSNNKISSRAWRLDYSNIEDKKLVEIKYINTITSYSLRYIKFPNPIITTTLHNGLEIYGVSSISESELDESIHDEILNLAVRKGIQSKLLFSQPQESKQNSNQ